MQKSVFITHCRESGTKPFSRQPPYFRKHSLAFALYTYSKLFYFVE